MIFNQDLLDFAWGNGHWISFAVRGPPVFTPAHTVDLRGIYIWRARLFHHFWSKILKVIFPYERVQRQGGRGNGIFAKKIKKWWDFLLDFAWRNIMKNLGYFFFFRLGKFYENFWNLACGFLRPWKWSRLPRRLTILGIESIFSKKSKSYNI